MTPLNESVVQQDVSRRPEAGGGDKPLEDLNGSRRHRKTVSTENDKVHLRGVGMASQDAFMQDTRTLPDIIVLN